MTSAFRPSMRDEIRKLVEDWGKNSRITRFISTTDDTGRESGSFQTQAASEKLWIQPIGGFSDVKEQGLDEQTTHLAFQLWSGTSMEAKDRILPSGNTYEYDVIRHHVKESHRVSELKLVVRS